MFGNYLDSLEQLFRFGHGILFVFFYLGAWGEFRVREYFKGSIAAFFALFLGWFSSGLYFENQPLAFAIMLFFGIGAPLAYYFLKTSHSDADE